MKNRYAVVGDSVFDNTDETGNIFCEAYHQASAPHIAEALNAHESKKGLSELDQLAVDYYASGRKLKIQCLVANTWSDEPDPSFHPNYEWRRKPTTETQTWDVFSHISYSSQCVRERGSVGHKTVTEEGWRIVGTLTGEVEV